MVGYFAGGILGALLILKDHWGAVGRDLAVAGYTWDEICGPRLPFGQFVAFVVYSPPDSAVFFRLHEGWNATTHKVSDAIEWLKMLVCVNAENPQKAYEDIGPERRPGVVEAEKPPVMTIGDYMRLSGMEE